MNGLETLASVRAAFALSSTLLLVTRLDDDRIVEVNDLFLRGTGFGRNDVIGRRVADLGFWSDLAQRERVLTALRTGESPRAVVTVLRTQRGEEIVASAAADRMLVDGEPCAVTALSDVTARVQAVAALRDSEHRFGQAFNVSPLPMRIVSFGAHRNLAVNDSAVRDSGFTRDELLSLETPPQDFWGTAVEREGVLEALRATGRARAVAATSRTKAGVQRHMLVNAELISYAGESAVLTVLFGSAGASPEPRAAGLGEAPTALRPPDEFLTLLGHELRNPLGTIINAVGMMNRLVVDEDLRRLSAIIGRQAVQVTRMVSDLLDATRAATGGIELQREVVDLREVAGRCLAVLAEADRLAEHDVALEGSSVRAYGDPARLEQVIRSLLDNALKFTPPGGRIRVITQGVGGDAVLRVHDTGEGIRPELLPRIFDLLARAPVEADRSRGGLGVGLTLVKRLVELHGGSVSAESAGPERGSEFTIRLPVQAGEGPRDTGEAAHDRGTSTRRRVLIVDDSRDARESLRLLLELGGHEVETAEDGLAGLAKLHTFRPDVALIDLALPGIDGYALARSARQSFGRERIRLIALTGYGEAEDREKAMDAGFDVHVTKPVDPERLEDLLRGCA